MSDTSIEDALFSDLLRKSVNLCFIRCVRDPSPSLTKVQQTCIKNCVYRYMECREVSLNALKDLANL